MHFPEFIKNQKGFSLLLMVLIFLGVALVAYGAITIGIKLQQAGEGNVTEDRMAIIAQALKKYYRGHADLPAPSSVPVADLGLEAKYKNDAWGQELKYYYRPSAGEAEYFAGTAGRTVINNFTIDGISNQAGALISGGPDQTIDTTISTSGSCTGGTSGTECNAAATFATAGDDILIPINVTEEAKEIAQEQMDVIRRKLWAFAVSNPAGTSPSSTFWIDYGLPANFAYDPWGTHYVLGSEYIKASDGSFLPVLTKPDAAGNAPPPLALGGSRDFNVLSDGKVDLGGGGAFKGTISSSDVTVSSGELTFDGNDDVTLGSNTDFGFDRIDSFTFSFKITPSALPSTGNMPIVSKREASDGDGYEIGFDSDGLLYFVMSNDGGAKNIEVKVDNTNCGQKLAINTTYHVVVTYNGTSTAAGVKIYINNVEQPKTPLKNDLDAALTITNTKAFKIGANNDSKYFEGTIDNLSVYDTILSAADRTALFDLDTLSLNTAIYYGTSDSSDQMGRGITVSCSEDALFVTGNFSESVALASRTAFIARYDIPTLTASTLPDWPRTVSSGTNLYDIASNSNGVYVGGANYTLTTDASGGKEMKGILMKYKLDGTAGGSNEGSAWYATPNFWPNPAYDGTEGFVGLAVADETTPAAGTYVYAVGDGQASGSVNAYFVSKHNITTGAQINSDKGASPTKSGFNAVTALNNNVYAAGHIGLKATIRKYNSALTTTWTTTDSVAGGFLGVIVSGDYVYAVGYRGDATSGGPYDVLIQKFNETTGALQWTKTWNAGDDDWANDLAIINDRLFVVGYSETGSGSNKKNALLLELDTADGDILSSVTWDSNSKDDVAKGIVVVGSDIYVVGETDMGGTDGKDLMILWYSKK